MSRQPTDSTQPEVFGVHHAAYRCRDAQETCTFYEGVLGFPLVQALKIDRHPTTGEPVDYMHVFFDIGSHDMARPSYIAFFEVRNRPGDDFKFKKQWGMDLHIAMGVARHQDLEVWRDRLQARGVEVEGPIDHEIFTSIYFHDPNGYRLEFCAQSDGEHQVFVKGSREAKALVRDWVKSR